MISEKQHQVEMLTELMEKVSFETICSAVVVQNPNVLWYVREQTLAICQAAVQKNPEAKRYVRDNAMLLSPKEQKVNDFLPFRRKQRKQ